MRVGRHRARAAAGVSMTLQGVKSGPSATLAATPSVPTAVPPSTALKSVGAQQFQFDGVSVDAVSISGKNTVKVLDGAVLGALDTNSTSTIVPTVMAQGMANKEALLSSWISSAKQRQLYYGVLIGTLGRWKQGQVLAYLRLADGPTCLESHPYSGAKESVSPAPCNVGILAPISGQGEDVTIEGVY